MARWSCLAIVLALSSPVVAAEKPRGFDSPEAAFQAYVSAAAAEDYDGMLATLTPQAKAWTIGLAVYSSLLLFSEDPATKQIFAEHEVTAALRSVPEDESVDEKTRERLLVEAMLKIKEPGKLMRRIAERHEQLAKLLAEKDDAKVNTPEPTAKELIPAVTLGKVTIDGDSATAKVTMAAPAKEVFAGLRDEAKFRRIGKRWFCDFDPR